MYIVPLHNCPGKSKKKNVYDSLFTSDLSHFAKYYFYCYFPFYTFIIILTYKEIMHFSGKVLLAISMLIITFLTGKKAILLFF